MGLSPNSVAVGDFNGDGQLDLAVANSGGNPGTVSVFLGLGDGGFRAEVTYPGGLDPASLAVGDFNGDGRPDLVVTSFDDAGVSVLLNQGAGIFGGPAFFAAGSRPQSVAVGDFNGDGRPDLAVANSLDNTVAVLLGTGLGSFGVQTTFTVGSQPMSVAVADFNGDGQPDLAVANLNSSTVSVLLNVDGGIFATQAPYRVDTAISVAVGDFNGDGKPDLAVGQGSSLGLVKVLFNSGDGTGNLGGQVDAYPVSGTGVSSVAVGDFDGDGWPDLAATSQGVDGGVVNLLLNSHAGGAFFFGAPMAYAVGAIPASVAAGDFNRDGRPDVAVANNGDDTASVLVNLGNGGGAGGFTLQLSCGDVGYFPSSVAMADLDGDGRLDLVVTNDTMFTDGGLDAGLITVPGNTVGVLLNRGGASFPIQSTYRVGNEPASAALGDLDGDGKPDLAVANNGDNTVSVLLNDGDGGFLTQAVYFVQSAPHSVAVGDFNGDGKLDLAVANNGGSQGDTQAAGTVSILLNAGGGTFGTQTPYAVGIQPYAVAVGDFDGDGKPDLAVTNVGDDTVSVLLGRGGGGFQAPATYDTGSAPWSVAVGDFNGDGKPDLAVANESDGTVSVLLNKGNGIFAAQTICSMGINPYWVAAGDFNGDGKPDLAVANNADNTASVLLGLGDGGFAPQQVLNVGASQPYAVAIGDLNGDGTPDLAVAKWDDGPVVVFVNRCGP